VNQIIDGLVINVDAHDSRVFIWGTSSYSSAKYYKFIFAQFPQDQALNSIWKSKCLPKLRVFTWLLVHDRLNTKDIMQRKNWHIEDGPACILCANDELETRDHLFFNCTFAHECWTTIGIVWDSNLPISDRIIIARAAFRGPCFMEIFACAAWNIWKERNDFIFNHQPHSLNRWKVRFQSDLLLHQYRVKAAMVQPLLEWILHTFV
jgi:hypothetical protein